MLQSTDVMEMHSKYLTINEVAMSDPSTKITRYSAVSENDTLRVFFNKSLGQNEYVLRIEFNGTLGNGNVGYYLAKYREGRKER